MTVYAIATRYQGTLLAADEAPLVIEGQWDYNKVVCVSRLGGIA